MRGIDAQIIVEFENVIEETVVECFGIAGGKVGSAGTAQQERISRHQSILDDDAHRVASVARGMEQVEAKFSDDDRLSIFGVDVDEGRLVAPMHDARHTEFIPQRSHRREVIRVGMCIEQESNS